MTYWRHCYRLINTKNHFVDGLLERKSPADELFQYITREDNNTFVTFPAEELSFEVISKNLERRKAAMTIHGNLVSGSYQFAKFKINVLSGRGPPKVAYTIMLEKISPDIEVPLGPEQIVDTILSHIRSTDESLYELNHTVNSNDAE